ncbi:MAG: hypothetical protein ACE5HD_03115 [Acidobacteriota bacterium]
MTATDTSRKDPLATRIAAVVELVHDLRREVRELNDRLSQAQQHIEELEQQRRTVRGRVEHMLAFITS